MHPSTVKPQRKGPHTEKKSGKVGTSEGIPEGMILWLIPFPPVQVHVKHALKIILGSYVNTVTYIFWRSNPMWSFQNILSELQSIQSELNLSRLCLALPCFPFCSLNSTLKLRFNFKFQQHNSGVHFWTTLPDNFHMVIMFCSVLTP